MPVSLKEVEAANALIVAHRFPWCRARLLHALGGAEEQGILEDALLELLGDSSNADWIRNALYRAKWATKPTERSEAEVMRKVGFYWVRVGGDLEPVVAQWAEWGAWRLCGDERDHPDAKVEVIRPIYEPDKKPTKAEMLERAAERVAELVGEGDGFRPVFVGFRVWTLQQGKLDFAQLATYLGCDPTVAVMLCLCRLPRPGTDDISRMAAHFNVSPAKLLALLEDPAFFFDT